jgi:acyl transferase domain-containing protein
MERVVREEGIFTPASLVDQFRGRVNILAVVEAAKNEKIITEHTAFIEIGHSATFTSILKTIMGRSWKALNSLKKNQSDYVSLTDALTTLYMEGFDIRWDQFVHDFADDLRVIELPHYKWDLKNYWIPYINDWSLRKGEPAQMPCSSARPRLVSRMIHSVHHQEWDGFQGSITLRSDLNHPEICRIVQGHKVNNLPLCTPVIFLAHLSEPHTKRTYSQYTLKSL